MESIGLGNDIDNLIDEFKENVNRINASAQNISSSTNRLTLEMKKGQELSAKHKVPLHKHELVLESAKHMINICTDFELSQKNEISAEHGSDKLNGGCADAELNEANAMKKIWNEQSSNENETQFEEFKTIIERQTERIEKEVCKLDSLHDILHEIRNDEE